MISLLVLDEKRRQEAFPITKKKVFLAHAGVAPLPAVVVDSIAEYLHNCTCDHQEYLGAFRRVKETRKLAAQLIGAQEKEIALLGPTSLGLNLFANGLDWQPGDEVLCYQDDYPANVYPWLGLRRKGVAVRYLKAADIQGELTPEIIQSALSPKTRLVALASCNFLSGYRIDISAIGKILHERDVLFALDAIQTLGAFPTTVEHVDFLSADSHKWMLGPLAIGIVYVKQCHFERLYPTLLGAWNVRAPNYIAQDQIVFPESAIRYEPGTLNIMGIYGMHAALSLLQEVGLPAISSRLLELKAHLVNGLNELGFNIISPASGSPASPITTANHPKVESQVFFEKLTEKNISISCRYDRNRRGYLRFSPHFYNAISELDIALNALKQCL